MTILSTKVFGGEAPRVPADKLPEQNAQLAVDCNFAYGELRPLKAPFALKTLADSAKSLFSVDGLNFASWPYKAKAFRGPVTDDMFDRFYFTSQTGGFRVSRLSFLGTSGGEPSSSYSVGVPPVTAQPTFRLVDLTSLPDYPNAVTKLVAFWDDGGVQYGVADITSTINVASIVPLKEASFPKPTKPTDAPEAAVLGVTVTLTDAVTGSVIYTLTTVGTTTSSRSDAIPGGIELSLVSVSDTTMKVVYTYGVVETRAYVVTIVNQWNEESKPSPTILVSPTYAQKVEITFAPPTLTGYVPYNKYRVYRSVGSSGEYVSITDAPVTYSGSSVTAYDSHLSVTNTDATLNSVGWDMPPSNLQGLTLLPNGFFAAFSGNTLYMSEPYRPWAWPYAMTFPVSLVGMRAMETSLVVTTLTYPYLVSGVHPSAMTQSQLTGSQAGVSDHGMCVVGNTVAYVSNDGLAVVSGYNVDLSISQKFWTREVWRSKYGSVLGQLELAYHDGSLVCGCPTAGLMWELRLDDEGGGNLTELNASARADALYVLPSSDQLYIVTGSTLSQYKGGSDQSATWWSKEYILTKPTLFTAGYINTTGLITLTVYADGQVWHTESFTSPSYFRLPTGRKFLRWSYKLEGSGYVKEISLAERRQELKGV